jgi:hypothetical protein
VKSGAIIELSKYEINFDTLIQGQQAWDSIVVRNTGNEDLIINSVSTTDGGSSAGRFSKVIKPNSTGFVIGGFPYSDRARNEKCLRIYSNAINKPFICVLMTVYFKRQKEVIFPNTKADTESFVKLKDSVIKKEIAFFNNIGNSITEPYEFQKTEVYEIPIVKCTDSSAIFLHEGTNVIICSARFDTAGHKFTYVKSNPPFLTQIDGKPIWKGNGFIPKEKLKSIKFAHQKHQFILPDSAIAGIYEPDLCYKDFATDRVTTGCFKVFHSMDNRRVYIYMKSPYEIIWVIQDNKYYTRIVDYGF